MPTKLAKEATWNQAVKEVNSEIRFMSAVGFIYSTERLYFRI